MPETVMSDIMEELEETLSNTCQKIYELGERRIKPTWPWVLIRLCPKEQMVRGIYMADNVGDKGQNKPLAEGIVLTTWAPFLDKLHPVKESGEMYYRERKSDFVPGDRVLFNHFAGLPVTFLDETKYRLVREWTFDAHGGVQSIVHYDGDKKYKPILDELFSDLASVTLSGR